jgi:hypothetical protein
VLSDLVSQATAAAPEHSLKGRGENEKAFDHFGGITLAGEVVAEDPGDVPPCDVANWRVAGLKHFAARFVEGDVFAMSGEFQRQTRQIFLCEVIQREIDTLPF